MADRKEEDHLARRATEAAPYGKGSKAAYSAPVLQAYGSVIGLTMGMGGTVPDFFMGVAMMGASDQSVKENIVRIGTHPLGFGLYLFDYKPEFRERWGTGRKLGVMADEVEKVMPLAVSVHADGYKMVDYAMLAATITATCE